MRAIIPIIIFAILAASPPALDTLVIKERKTISYTIGAGSELNITGTSNISKFCCNSQQTFPPGDLEYEWVTDSRIKINNARLVIDANDLDCGHKPVTRDFKRTLLVEQHPQIIFDLHELALRKDLAAQHSEWNWAVADTEITLAGCTNHKFLNVQYQIKPDNQIELRAFARLCVSDFGLDSPKPMLGLIKVEDEVDVEIYMSIQLHGQG